MKNLNRFISILALISIGMFSVGVGVFAQTGEKPGPDASRAEIVKYYGLSSLKGANNVLTDLPDRFCSTDAPVEIYVDAANLDPTRTDIEWTVYTGAVVTGNYEEHNDWVTPIGTSPNNGISFNPAVVPSAYYGVNVKISYKQIGTDGSLDDVDVTVVNKTPSAYDFTQTAVVCDGDITTISLPTTDPGTYYNLYRGVTLINTDGAFLGDGNAINFFVNEAGTYTVKGFDNNTEASSKCFTWMTGSAEVTVNTRPTPTVGGDNDVCVGDAGVTYSTESGMSGYTWSVSAGGTITAGAGTDEITVTWNTSGAQSVSVNYTHTNGCEAENPTVYAVTVNDLPNPTIAGSNSVCVGDAGLTYSTEVGMNNYVWTISAGGTITAGAGTNEITVDWDATGPQTITVEYENTSNCGTVTPTVLNVTVNELPSPAISGDNIVCESDAGVTYTTDPGMSNYVWVVTGGTITGGAGTEEITVTWNTAGSQTVSVNYENAAGCPASTPTTYNVTVNALPVVTVSGDNDVCEGEVGVTYSTEPGMNNYVWSISAGGTIDAGTGTNQISVTWNTPGAQSVSVNYDNAQGCDALTPTNYNVNVNAAPTPSLAGSNNVCVGDAGVLYTTDAGMNNYVWNVIGGTVTAGAGTNQITVTWNTDGVQTVTVNYDNALGCPAATPTSYNVTVNPLPVPTVSGTNAVCEGTTGVTYSTETGMNNYVWSVSAGGTITAGAGTDEITVTWNTAGAQTVSVNYDNALGCNAASTTNYPVSVNALPVPVISGNLIVCEGDAGVNYATDPGMNNYVWSVSAGGTITAGAGTDEITVTWNGSGAQTVSVNYVNTSGCTATSPTTSNITVNAAPVPTILGTASVCEGDAGVTYTTEGSMSNYVWTVSSGGTITGGTGTNEITVTWNTAGAQTVSVNYDNASGCSALTPTVSNITVNQVNAILNITNPTPPGTNVCSGTTVTFSASGTDGSGDYNYEFFVDGASQGVASTTSTRDITINANMLVEVEVTDNVNGCIDRTAINMTAIAIPNVNLSQPVGGQEYCENEAVTLTAAPSGYANYVYYSTDGTTNTQLNTLGSETFEVSSGFDTSITGVYVIASDNGCSAQSSTINISINALPTADAGSNQSICEDDGLVLDGSASGGTAGYTFNWTGPNGYVANDTEDPDLGTADLNEEGTYILTVIDSKGCQDTDEVEVSLDELPQDQTVVAENTEYCEASTGVRIYLQNSEAGVTYQLQDAGDNPVGSDVVADGVSTVEWTNVASGTYHVVAFGSTVNACSIRMSTADITINENPLPQVYNITPSDVDLGCNGGAGWPIGLDDSEVGIEYQLLRNGSPYGASVVSTGGALTLNSNVTAFGVYTIRATNPTTLCNVMMNEDYEIQSDVVVTTYDITSTPGTGDYCISDADPGVTIGMTGSDATVEYLLILNGNSEAPEQRKTGDGSVLSFDNKVTIDGVYTVQVETPGGCSFPMNGSVAVTAFNDPTVFSLQADNNGFYCPDPDGSPVGVNIWLVGQQNGVEYTLWRENGGAPVNIETVTGTVDDGSALLNFTGPFVLEDNYYVVASRPGVGCTSTMNNIIAVTENPLMNGFNVSKSDDFCTGSSVSIFIDGSEADAEYRWVANDGTADIANGSWTAGTGTALEFSGIIIEGTYRVEARRLENGITCFREMLNTVDVLEKLLPEDKTWLISGGTGCDDGVVITIENSQVGAIYHLFKRGTPDTEVSGAEIIGDGNNISFAPITDSGANYNVVAELNGCTNDYDINIPIDIAGAITKLTVDGGGSVCSGGAVGAVIGMSESTVADVRYELFLADNPGADTGTSKGVIDGDGTVRNFGNQTDLGEYYVIATNIFDGSCPTEMTNRVTIAFYPNPTAELLSDEGDIICEGTEVTFTASGGANYQFYLNGNPLGSMAAVSTYVNSSLSDGDRVSVMVESADGCTDMSDDIAMTVNPMPTAKNVGTSGTFCQGSSSSVSVYVIDPEVGFTYTLIDESDESTVGTDDTLPILFENIDEGTYRVEASANGCSVVMNNPVNISAQSLPSIYSLDPNGVENTCVAIPVKLLNSELGIAYTLYRDGNIVGGPTDGTHDGVEVNFGDYNITGIYTVRAENISSGCQRDMQGQLTITAGSGNTYDVEPVNGSYCQGDSPANITLTDSDAGVKYTLYYKGTSTGIELTSSADDEVLDFGAPASGDGTYSIIAEDTGGCLYPMNNDVIIQGFVSPTSFNLETQNGLSSEEYCPGDAGVDAIHVKGQQLGVTYILYDENDIQVGVPQIGIIEDANVDIVFTGPFDSDTYRVEATNTAGCTSIMNNVVNISESPALRDDFEVVTSGDICTGGAATITTNGSETNVRYWLYRNGFNTGNFIDGDGGVLDPPFSVSQGGTYTLEAENIAGCRTFLVDDAVISETNLPKVKAIVSDGGIDCSVGAVITVQLADPDIIYQLYKRTGNGDILVDGSDISHSGVVPTDIAFDPITDRNAYYTVKASNGSCNEIDMSNDPGVDLTNFDDVYVDISEAALRFEVTPDIADICNGDQGRRFGLINSEEGVVYSLYRAQLATETADVFKESITGPLGGGSIQFVGVYNEPGEYYVLADNGLCATQTEMINRPTLTVNPLPTAFKMTGSGFYCDVIEGAEIGLESQEANVRYTLQFEDGSHVGDVLGGSFNDSISFGEFTMPGSYTAVAINENTLCTSNMEGVVEVIQVDTPEDQFLLASTDTVYCGIIAGVEFILANNELDVTYQVREVSTSNIISEVVGTNDTGSDVELAFPDIIPEGTYEIWKSRGGDACVSITNGGKVIEVIHESEPNDWNIEVDKYNACSSEFVTLTLDGFDDGRAYRIENDDEGAILDTITNLDRGSISWELNTSGLETGTVFYEVFALSVTGACDKSMGLVKIDYRDAPAVPQYILSDTAYCDSEAGVNVGIQATENGIAYILRDEFYNAYGFIDGNGSDIYFLNAIQAGRYYISARNFDTGCETLSVDSFDITINPNPDIQEFYIEGFECVTAPCNGIVDVTELMLANSVLGTTYSLMLDNAFILPMVDSIGTSNSINFGTRSESGEYTVIATNIEGCSAIMDGVVQLDEFPLEAITDSVSINKDVLVGGALLGLNDIFNSAVDELGVRDDLGLIVEEGNIRFKVVDGFVDTSGQLIANEDGELVTTIGVVAIDSITGVLNYEKLPGFYGLDSLRYSIVNRDNPDRYDEAIVYIYVGNKALDENKTFLIPNAFSPNGDDINDYFKITGINKNGVTAEKSSLEVFNRWGTLVYRSKGDVYGDDNEWWDGTSSTSNMVSIGSELPNGTYFYIFKVQANEKVYNEDNDMYENKIIEKEYNGYIELRR